MIHIQWLSAKHIWLVTITIYLISFPYYYQFWFSTILLFILAEMVTYDVLWELHVKMDELNGSASIKRVHGGKD